MPITDSFDQDLELEIQARADAAELEEDRLLAAQQRAELEAAREERAVVRQQRIQELEPSGPDDLLPGEGAEAGNPEAANPEAGEDPHRDHPQGELDVKALANAAGFDATLEEDDGDDVGFLGTLGDIGTGIVGGLRDAGVNVAQTVLDLGGLVDSGIDVDKFATSLGIDVDDQETMTGQFFRSTAQFMTVFIPVLGAIRVLKGVGAVSKALTAIRATRFGPALTGSIAKNTFAGAVTDFAVFDPHEARFSDMLVDFGVDNPITNYLQADPEDSAAEGRLKNVLEGVGLGLIFDGVIRGISKARGVRRTMAQASVLDDVPPEITRVVQGVHDGVLHERSQMDHLVQIREELIDLNTPKGDPGVEEARQFLARTGDDTLDARAVNKADLDPELAGLVDDIDAARAAETPESLGLTDAATARRKNPFDEAPRGEETPRTLGLTDEATVRNQLDEGGNQKGSPKANRLEQAQKDLAVLQAADPVNVATRQRLFKGAKKVAGAGDEQQLRLNAIKDLEDEIADLSGANLSPEARQFIDGAEARGISFEDSVRDLDADAKRQHPLAMLDELNPEMAAKLRAATGDIGESINTQLAEARKTLQQAEEDLWTVRQTDEYNGLSPEVRKDLEKDLDPNKYC